MVNKINPKSQLDKRLDAATEGKTYMAGNGIFFSGDKENRINLHPAGSGTAGYGGVTVTNKYWSEWTPFTDSEEEPDMYRANYGLYMYGNDHYLRLRTATAKQKGGFYLGDGFTPLFNTETDEDGNIKYNYTSKVELRLGDGLKFIDNAYPLDETEAFRNRVSGRRVAVAPATEKTLGGIKVGEGLKIKSDGTLSAESGASYEQGDGIVIDEGEEKKKISVSIDNDTITLEDGKLKAKGLTIENAVIIKEADSKYFLHEYTEIEYIAGNKVVYGTPQSSIVVQGYIFFNVGAIAPNGVQIANGIISTNPDDLPDIPAYTGVYLSVPAYHSGFPWFTSFEYILDEIYADYNVYHELIKNAEGAVLYTGRAFSAYHWPEGFGTFFLWSSILPPGSVVSNVTFEFGGVRCYGGRRQRNSTDYSFGFDSSANYYFPFASIAEYNAAVRLTYEPVTLTEVQETVTEV